MFEMIKKDSMTESIIQQIQEKILTGELKTGDKLPPERKLVKLFGVSRTSLREAIQALSFSGYLEVIHGKGAFVTDTASKHREISELLSQISNISLDSLMEIRVMLEGDSARLAALRAGKKDILYIEECLKQVKNSETIRLFILNDLKLHLAVAEATHNSLLFNLMKIFGEILHKQTSQLIDITEQTRDRSIKNMTSLVKAIKEQEAEMARRLMINHLSDIKPKKGVEGDSRYETG